MLPVAVVVADTLLPGTLRRGARPRPSRGGAADLGLVASPRQQAGDGDIFVQRFPVDAFAAADQFSLLPLFGRAEQKAGEPGQGDRQFAAVIEHHSEHIPGE